MRARRGLRGLALFAAAATALWILRESLTIGSSASAQSLVAASFSSAILVVCAPFGSVLALGAAGALAAFGTLLFLVEPDAWVSAALLGVGSMLVRPFSRATLSLLSLTFALPALLLAIARFGGFGDAETLLLSIVGHALGGASSTPLWIRAATLTSCLWLFASLVAGSRDDALPRGTVARRHWVLALGVAALIALIAVRFRDTLLLVLLPSDVHEWSESPLLLDVLKLRHRIPLYGPPESINSYTYSPGIVLLHTALLAPFGGEFRPELHHALVVVWQAATVALLVSALAPRLATRVRAETWLRLGAIGLAFFGILWASPASPGLHPDHIIHLGAAASVFLLLRRDRFPPRAFWTAVALLPPALSAFKLTGIGVGLGFLLALWGDRDDRWGRPLGIALTATAALVPAFDLLFGRFSFYAIGSMSHHPIYLRRLPSALASGPGLAVLAALAVAMPRQRDDSSRADTRRLALFTVGLAMPTWLGYLKEGGAWNNLVVATLPAACIFFLIAADRRQRRFATPSLVSVALALVVAIHPTSHFTRADHEVARTDYAVATRALREDFARGLEPLSLGSTSAFIDAGGRGIPEDCGACAVELFMGRSPEFSAHLARLASGRYSTLVAQGRLFLPMSSVTQPFGALYRGAVEPHYCVIYPVDARGRAAPLTVGNRLLTLRRRDLGCEPLSVVPAVRESLR